MAKKIHVHIADDHKIVIDGITAVINTDPDIEIAGYSLNGQQIINWFSKRKNKANVIILDITMPEGDGFEVLRFLKSKRLSRRVIVLSSYDDVKIVQEVLKLGAKGYITKTNAGEHIIRGIKTVAKGEQYFSNDIQKILLDSLSNQNSPFGNMPDELLFHSLTEREKDVLRLVAAEDSTTEIADKLNVGISTVETYRKSLLRKLKVKNSVGLALYAVKNKLV